MKYASIVDLVEEHPHRTKYTAWGSYMSASSPYIYNPKECILIGYKDQWKREDDGKSTMTKEEFIEIVGGLWKYRAETRKLTQANFSMDIPLKAIKGMSYEDDIILDPFSGSGTTLYVAKQLNRRYIGIEISKAYCGIATNKLMTMDYTKLISKSSILSSDF